MTHRSAMALAGIFTFALLSCGEKKQNNDIIAPKPVEKKAALPTKMQGFNNEETVDWLGKRYVVKTSRQADTSMPMFSDDAGNKCYENKITVTVVRPDGTEFFSRTFTKSDFASYVDADYLKRSTMLGFAVYSVEGDNVVFSASVGSPDVLSDDFVPLVVTLSRMGGLTIKKDSQIGTSSEPEMEEEGV